MKSRAVPAAGYPNRDLVYLVKLLVVNFLLSALVFLGITILMGPTPDTIRRALKATAPAQVLRLQDRGSTDSWRPMLTAYTRKLDDPRSDLYSTFFVDRVKFLYPPSSLLFFDLFPRSMLNLDDLVRLIGPLKRVLDDLSRIAVGLTVLGSTLIFERGIRRTRLDRSTPSHDVASIALSLAVGLSFYPMLVAYFIGQIQVFLNALLVFAVLFFIIGWRSLAGICVGVCCLVKPQYGLMLLWSVSRRQWQFTLGLLGVAIAGIATSIARFGLADHISYLRVLQDLSRVGETFWFNQSINGLLNRLLENGSPLLASPRVPSELPPYHPVVYALTLVSSLAILVLALRRPRGTSPDDGVLGLLIMLVAVTMASPIAWNHHYGAFLAVFAAVTPPLLRSRPLGQATVPVLAFSYIAMANLLILPEVVFRSRWLGVVGSHLLFASLTLFALLLFLRAARWDLTGIAKPS